MEKSERQLKDQEPETSSSKNSKVKMASSAFDRKQDATTIFFDWESQDSCEYDFPLTSAVFGSKKTHFFISLQSDIDFENEEYIEEEEEELDVYLNLADSSIKKKVFIESLSISADNSKVFHNKVLTSTTPLFTTNVTLTKVGLDYFEGCFSISMEITFRELEDGWNSQKSLTPINHAEVLCRQLATTTSSLPTDVTLKTMDDEKLFPAHKFILKMRSPVFAAMFSGDFVENKAEKPVEIFEISGPVMEAMLAYMYCKPFENWKMMAGELAAAADMYNIQSLYDACIASLLADITVESAAKNFYYAHIFNSTDVKEIAQFIRTHENEVKLTDGWKELTEERGDSLEKMLSEVLPKKKKKAKKAKRGKRN